MAAISPSVGEQGSVGKIEEARLYAKRLRGGGRLGAPDAAEFVGRLAPAGGAVSGDGEREAGTHRMPGEERAAEEDLEVVGVRAKREDADCAFRSRHGLPTRLRHARNDSMMQGPLRNRGLGVDQALVLAAVRHLAFEPLPLRPPAPDEVLIRTLYSGISAGTELSQYRGIEPLHEPPLGRRARACSATAMPSWTFPVRNLGYEEVGQIVEVGSGVTRVRPGQLVFGDLGPPQHAHRCARTRPRPS